MNIRNIRKALLDKAKSFLVQFPVPLSTEASVSKQDKKISTSLQLAFRDRLLLQPRGCIYSAQLVTCGVQYLGQVPRRSIELFGGEKEAEIFQRAL